MYFLETLTGIAQQVRNEVTHPWILNGSTWNFFLFQMDPISCCLTQRVEMTARESVSAKTIRQICSTMDCLLVHDFCFLNDFMIVLGDFHVFFIRKVHHGTKI